MIRQILGGACVVIAAGCGSDGSPAPAAPAASVQSITVNSSSDQLYIGASETFTATAAMSNGGSQPVSGGVWGTDAPFAATVEASSGRVTGVGSGMATIFVDFQGRRGTRLVRVLPNYQGAWSGSYTIRSCVQTGDFARGNLCSNFPVNRVLPTNMNLTQERDRVQGRFFLGTLGGNGSGPVQTDGRLLLTGAIQDPVATVETNWTIDSPSAGRMVGGLSLLWRAPGASGDMRIQADIRDLNRTSSLVATTAQSSRPARTLSDMIGALAGR